MVCLLIMQMLEFPSEVSTIPHRTLGKEGKAMLSESCTYTLVL